MVKNYLKSVRITNLILLGVLFWGIMYQIYNNEFSFCMDHLLLFLAIISTTASGYLINNYYDIRSDEINRKSLFKLTSNYLIKGYFLHFVLSFVFLVNIAFTKEPDFTSFLNKSNFTSSLEKISVTS